MDIFLKMRLEALGTFELLSVTMIPPSEAFAAAVCTLLRFGFLPFGLLLLLEIGATLSF